MIRYAEKEKWWLKDDGKWEWSDRRKKRYPIREENWGKVRHSGAKTFLGQNYTLEAMSREAHQICSQISNSTMYSKGWPHHIVHSIGSICMLSSNVHKCWKWRLKGPGWLVIERAWTGSMAWRAQNDCANKARIQTNYQLRLRWQTGLACAAWCAKGSRFCNNG